MTNMRISYRAGYKYQLVDTTVFRTDILGYKCEISGGGRPYIQLFADGTMFIYAGYAWDGASGPMPDVKAVMRGSLGHDALYQLIREGHLPKELKDHADQFLQQCCVDDGMRPIVAKLVYEVVKHYGAPHLDPATNYPVLSAP